MLFALERRIEYRAVELRAINRSLVSHFLHAPLVILLVVLVRLLALQPSLRQSSRGSRQWALIEVQSAEKAA